MRNNTCCLLLLLWCFASVSCEKEVTADRFQGSDKPFAGTTTLTGIINTSRVLHKDTLYQLKGVVWITAGNTLTIEPGVRVECIKSENNTQLPATLIVLPTARIECNGTAAEPVVFTSHALKPAPGDWGGILLLGQAGGQYYGNSLLKTLAPFNHQADSLILQSDSAWRYGNNYADNSGTVTYTRIEYAGIPHILSPLTLCGSGSTTLINYVEVAWSRNHAFEFRGGNTSASHLISLAPVQNAFATKMGYKGRLSYSLSLTHPRAADSAFAAISYAKTLYGKNSSDGGVEFDHITVIGLSSTPPPFYLAHWHSNTTGKEHTNVEITNSVFLGFPGNTPPAINPGVNISCISPSRFHNYTENNDSVQLISPWDWADFRPASGSPAAGIPVSSIDFKGAFAPDAFPWTGSWARFDY